MFTFRLPSTVARAGDEHSLDLELVCARDETVMVCSRLLRDATRSAAVKDIIEHASAKAVMAVPDDSAAAWRGVWSFIQRPMDPCKGLTMGNIEQVIRLADKYHLLPPLQACEVFITTAVAGKHSIVACSSSAFGGLDVVGQPTFPLTLPFLDLLCHVNMMSAVKVLSQEYVVLLDKACSELKDTRKELTDISKERTRWQKDSLRDQERMLSTSVGRQLQAMSEFVTFFCQSPGSQSAARVEAIIKGKILEVVSGLALTITGT